MAVMMRRMPGCGYNELGEATALLEASKGMVTVCTLLLANFRGSTGF